MLLALEPLVSQVSTGAGHSPSGAQDHKGQGYVKGFASNQKARTFLSSCRNDVVRNCVPRHAVLVTTCVFVSFPTHCKVGITGPITQVKQKPGNHSSPCPVIQLVAKAEFELMLPSVPKPVYLTLVLSCWCLCDVPCLSVSL